MSRKKGTHNCVICRDPRRPEIEAARAEGLSYPAMAGRFWVPADALRNHFKRLAALAEAEQPERLGLMPQQPRSHDCVICRDPRRLEIEAARAEGLAYGVIAGRFWVTANALSYHFERGKQPAEDEQQEGAD
jgi:hypothetical protein